MTSFKIGGDGGDAFPFDKVGDTVTGSITAVVEQQQTDMDTSQLAFWDNGDKKLMWKVSIQTELRADPGDTGVRSVFLRGAQKAGTGSSLAAVMDAVKAAGGTNELQTGGILSMTYTGDGPQEKRGFNKPKKYSAIYTPASVAIGAAEPAAVAPAAVPAAAVPPPSAPVAAAPAPVAAAVIPAAQAPAAVPAPAPASGKPTVTAAQFAALAAAGLDTTGFDIAV